MLGRFISKDRDLLNTQCVSRSPAALVIFRIPFLMCSSGNGFTPLVLHILDGAGKLSLCLPEPCGVMDDFVCLLFPGQKERAHQYDNSEEKSRVLEPTGPAERV